MFYFEFRIDVDSDFNLFPQRQHRRLRRSQNMEPTVIIGRERTSSSDQQEACRVH